MGAISHMHRRCKTLFRICTKTTPCRSNYTMQLNSSIIALVSMLVAFGMAAPSVDSGISPNPVYRDLNKRCTGYCNQGCEEQLGCSCKGELCG
ncbi:hypothetical protein CDEST_15354 [Colletotrichum destructivum]|uniref:Uncharacterized protein n=1 Tax=Colletotrichum destructivum TaxID=34406 RepID=A0AAX4J4B6_9PEZI|nr:hypothetical protein CDEST_15354 [Colletotrichum destructivum]